MNTFRFNTGKNFITSDLHLGHAKPFIWEKRGYTSIQDHDDKIIDKINELVGPNDTLFSLGDFCLNTTEPQLESYLSRIACQNIYLYVNALLILQILDSQLVFIIFTN